MNANLAVVHHITYIVISIGLTVWVGRTLFKSGRIFILESFRGNEPMADSVNHLLLVGFYLINFGIVSLFLKFGPVPTDSIEFVELLSVKIGVVLLLLGMMHFFNIINITRMRRKARKSKPINKTTPRLKPIASISSATNPARMRPAKAG